MASAFDIIRVPTQFDPPERRASLATPTCGGCCCCCCCCIVTLGVATLAPINKVEQLWEAYFDAPRLALDGSELPPREGGDDASKSAAKRMAGLAVWAALGTTILASTIIGIIGDVGGLAFLLQLAPLVVWVLMLQDAFTRARDNSASSRAVAWVLGFCALIVFEAAVWMYLILASGVFD